MAAQTIKNIKTIDNEFDIGTDTQTRNILWNLFNSNEKTDKNMHGFGKMTIPHAIQRVEKMTKKCFLQNMKYILVSKIRMNGKTTFFTYFYKEDHRVGPQYDHIYDLFYLSWNEFLAGTKRTDMKYVFENKIV